MKPALLLIHGLGSSARAFDSFRAELESRGYACHTPDLPGFGAQAGLPTLDKAYEAAVSYLTAYIDDIPGPLAVIGHSMGGSIGLLFGRERSGRVVAYVSIEGNLIPEDCNILSRKLAAGETEAEMEGMKTYLIDFARGLSESWHIWADDVVPIDAKTFRNYAHDLVTGTDDGTFKTLFDNLTCPKLYIYGDLYIDHPLLKRLPATLTKHIPNAGHFTMQDQPKLCADAVEDLILAKPV